MNNTCYVCLWYHPETGKFARLGLHSEGPNTLTHDGRLVPLMVFEVKGPTFETAQDFAKGRIRSESTFKWLVPWLDAYVHGSNTPPAATEKTSSDAEIKSLSDWCTTLETRLLVVEDQPQALKNKVSDVEMRVQMLDQRSDARWEEYAKHIDIIRKLHHEVQTLKGPSRLSVQGEFLTWETYAKKLETERDQLYRRLENQRAEIHTFQTTLRKLLDGESKKE